MDSINITKEKILSILNDFAYRIGTDENNIFLNYKLLEQHTNQIIFELIKDTYIEEAGQTSKSLYEHSGGIGAEKELKQSSRIMQFSNYYRNELSNEFEQNFNYIPRELKSIDMNETSNRCTGYAISDYDFEQIKIMNILKLPKYLTSRRITNLKSVSNYALDEAFQAYRDYFGNLKKRTYNDVDYIKYSTLLFTTELKFHIETTYRLATKLSEYNNCKSKSKFTDDFVERTSVFLEYMSDMNADSRFIKENSLILKKLDDIKMLNPDNFNIVISNYLNNLVFAFYAKQAVLKYTNIREKIKNASYAEKREFVENNYNIWEILDEDIVWENKKEKHVRDIYDYILKDIKTPTIK